MTLVVSFALVDFGRLLFLMAKTKESATRAAKSPVMNKASPKSASRAPRSPAMTKPKKPAAAKSKRAPPKADPDVDDRPTKKEKIELMTIVTAEGMKKFFQPHSTKTAASQSSEGATCTTPAPLTGSSPVEPEVQISPPESMPVEPEVQIADSDGPHAAANQSSCVTVPAADLESCQVLEQSSSDSAGAALPHQHVAEPLATDAVQQADIADECVAQTEASPAGVCDVRAEFAANQSRRKARVGEFLNWPKKLIQKVWQDQAPDRHDDTQPEYSDLLSHMEGCISGLRLSTAFSGIDTPAVALDVIAAAVATESGASVGSRPQFHNLWGVEWYSKSQFELQRSPHGPRCLFSDISEFWSPCMSQKLDTLIEQGRLVEVMVQLLSSPTTDISTITCSHAHCLNCNKMCKASWTALTFRTARDNCIDGLIHEP